MSRDPVEHHMDAEVVLIAGLSKPPRPTAAPPAGGRPPRRAQASAGGPHRAWSSRLGIVLPDSRSLGASAQSLVCLVWSLRPLDRKNRRWKGDARNCRTSNRLPPVRMGLSRTSRPRRRPVRVTSLYPVVNAIALLVSSSRIFALPGPNPQRFCRARCTLERINRHLLGLAAR